jgi:hypothetical protein
MRPESASRVSGFLFVFFFASLSLAFYPILFQRPPTRHSPPTPRPSPPILRVFFPPSSCWHLRSIKISRSLSLAYLCILSEVVFGTNLKLRLFRLRSHRRARHLSFYSSPPLAQFRSAGPTSTRQPLTGPTPSGHPRPRDIKSGPDCRKSPLASAFLRLVANIISTRRSVAQVLQVNS